MDEINSVMSSLFVLIITEQQQNTANNSDNFMDRDTCFSPNTMLDKSGISSPGTLQRTTIISQKESC